MCSCIEAYEWRIIHVYSIDRFNSICALTMVARVSHFRYHTSSSTLLYRAGRLRIKSRPVIVPNSLTAKLRPADAHMRSQGLHIIRNDVKTTPWTNEPTKTSLMTTLATTYGVIGGSTNDPSSADKASLFCFIDSFFKERRKVCSNLKSGRAPLDVIAHWPLANSTACCSYLCTWNAAREYTCQLFLQLILHIINTKTHINTVSPNIAYYATTYVL